VSTSLRDQLQTALGSAFVLDRELGGGGMSHVFLAHEQALGRQVVVKVLLPELAAGVNVDRFRREIQLAAQLQHPHIVPLLSAGEADGLPYFIMPYVTGESLRSRVAREGELPIAETVRILRDVVSALAYAHARGVVHRDVKPDNVLLSGGVAVVTDFGVAKAVTASAEESEHGRITSLGVALGTPAYMSPEQATASPLTDHRADLYALGVMTYEMLTGLPPFTGRSAQAVLAAHVVEEPQPVERRRPAVPPALATLVHQCLAKRPADRPQAATEIMHVLDSLATPSGTAPTTEVQPVTWPSVATPPVEQPGRHRGWLAAGLAAMLAAVAVGLLVRRPQVETAADGTRSLSAAAESTAPTPGPEARGAGAPSATRPEPRPDTVAQPTPSKPPARSRPTRTAGDRPTPRPERAAPAPVDSTVARRTDSTIIPSEPTPSPPAVTPPAPVVVETQPPVRPAPPRAPERTVPAPAPVPPASPVDPRPEIRAVLDDYAAAIEATSLADLRRIYPGMTAAQQRGWEQFFQLVRDVKAELRIARLDVANGSAEAQVGGSYTYLNTSTQRNEHQPVSFQATLRREGGGWRIVQIR
jgi:serine/threonine-protein kinase